MDKQSLHVCVDEIVSSNLIDKTFNSNTTTNNCKSYLPPKLPTSSYTLAKVDSGASNHYFKPQDLSYLKNVTPEDSTTQVSLPDSSTLQATHKGYLQFPSPINRQATQTIILPTLHNNLLSVGQLCDDNCTVTFNKHKINIYKNGELLLQGFRSQNGDGLWDLPIPRPPSRNHEDKQVSFHHPKPSQSLNIIIHPDTSTKDINKIHVTAWKLGLKSLYYQHSMNAAQKFKQKKECESCEG